MNPVNYNNVYPQYGYQYPQQPQPYVNHFYNGYYPMPLVPQQPAAPVAAPAAPRAVAVVPQSVGARVGKHSLDLIKKTAIYFIPLIGLSFCGYDIYKLIMSMKKGEMSKREFTLELTKIIVALAASQILFISAWSFLMPLLPVALVGYLETIYGASTALATGITLYGNAISSVDKGIGGLKELSNDKKSQDDDKKDKSPVNYYYYYPVYYPQPVAQWYPQHQPAPQWNPQGYRPY